VEEVTGRGLPLHGYNLFAQPRFPGRTDLPSPAKTVIGPGDEIDLRVWGIQEYSGRLVVDKLGEIQIPKVGPIPVSGIALEKLEAHLQPFLSRVFSNFEFSATLGRVRAIPIYVVGQARVPGLHMVSGHETFLGALFAVAGPSAAGSLRAITLIRAGKPVATLDLYKLIHQGELGQDAALQAGDVISIPAAGPRVALTGAVEQAGIFELLHHSERLDTLLAWSASRTTLAAPHRVQIERVEPTKAQAPRKVQSISLESARLLDLRDGDLIQLQPMERAFENAVTLRGNVLRPLRHAHREGMRVRDLIPEPNALVEPGYYQRKNRLVQFESGTEVSADRVLRDVRLTLDEINWSYATIERLDPKALQMTLIPFHLGKAVNDPGSDQNLLLQPGDVVSIFGVRDLPTPIATRKQYVRVTGEVLTPGVYEISPGQGLSDLLMRAGGLTEQAYAFGAVFTRERVRQQQQESLERALKRAEQQLEARTSEESQSALAKTAESTGREAAQQLQLTQQRQTLARLRSLRASGRIALALDARRPVLPSLPLEDGDHLYVPPRPSSVGVFGAVLLESNLLHRPGLTVADYLKRAGPLQEAELDDLLLIRADGSVLSERTSSRWTIWGTGLNAIEVEAGDTLFVPERIDRRSGYAKFIEGAKDWTQLIYQMGLGAAAIQTLRNP
jgi:protein involved in polysaccharide export with SLBB domain